MTSLDQFLDSIGIQIEEDDYIEHFGVKGMHWGSRKASTSSSGGSSKGKSSSEKITTRSSRKELRQIGKSSRMAIKQAAKAKTPQERKAAADKYQKDVIDKINQPGFKEKYKKANTLTKGEVVAHLVAFGPLGLVTLAGQKQAYEAERAIGADQYVKGAKEVLKSLQS